MGEMLEGNLEKMDFVTLARWMCLIEGIDVIYNKLEEDGMPDNYLYRSKKSFNILERSLLKYIQERFEAMKWDLSQEMKKMSDAS